LGTFCFQGNSTFKIKTESKQQEKEEKMGLLILATICILVAIFTPRFIPERLGRGVRNLVRSVATLAAMALIAMTSYVNVGQNQTGHLHKIYLGTGLTGGDIIATNGERGPQAKVMSPGFKFSPFIRIINTVTMAEVVTIPEGQYGYLVARDGAPLRADQTYADAFSAEDADRMISDAAYFLNNGGQKGPQTTVLTPGKYRLNMFLWKVEKVRATEIKAGFVGVIKSNALSQVNFGNLRTDVPSDCSPTMESSPDGGALAVPLVPVGCIGVWDKALNPGKYYINTSVFSVTMVDTRVQKWSYKGGYKKRVIDLTVSQEGDIIQTESSSDISVPKEAIGNAITVKIEGWDVPLELRVLVQVTPENAPFVVASVGGLEQVEERVLTPAIRSIVRNVAGSSINLPTAVLDNDGEPVLDETGTPETITVRRPTRVLDLIGSRSALESNVEMLMRPEGKKAGVIIKEVRFGEPVIPPELLVARQREQLATQLQKAYKQERTAQEARIATEQARATADMQPRLVEAEIEVRRSEQFAIARLNEGQGEKDKLVRIAEGQAAQVAVLGEERVVELRKFELVTGRIMTFLEDNPNVLMTALSNAQKFVPERFFAMGSGGSNDLSAAAAILGDFLSRPANNLTPQSQVE